MIADTNDTRFEIVVKLITAPVWLPLYGLYLGAKKLRRLVSETRFQHARRKPIPEAALLVPQMWTPVSGLERQVFAAMILAGRPVTNAELARLMGVSAGQASKMVKALEERSARSALRKQRIGREVRISLPPYH